MTLTPNGTDIRLHTRALLVWLTISSWSGHKFDREITDKVNRDINTSVDGGRYNKHLLKGSQNLKAVQTLIGAIRNEHYARTLAWSDEGWRLLTNENYIPYTDWFRERSGELERAVCTLTAGYDDDITQDAIRLNGAFCRADYPEKADLGQRFALSIAYNPIPADGDVRVDLGADHVAYIESAIREQLTGYLQNAVGDAWSRLRDVVAKMADKLSDPEGVFRDSLIGNARDTCDMLSRLNVTNDPALDAMRKDVEKYLTAYDAQALRDHRRVRSFVANKAQELLDQMKANGVIR